MLAESKVGERQEAGYMANSSLSGLSEKAGGALSSLRNRFGSRSRNRREDDFEDYGDYDDYGEYGEYEGADSNRYGGPEDYGEYGYDPDEPYDDYTGSENIGEIRTRAASSSPRYTYPPLVSFDEARTNSYVSDRFRSQSHGGAEQRGSRSQSAYAPRVRDSVNFGYASEYDFASVGRARLDGSGAEIPPIDANREGRSATTPSSERQAFQPNRANRAPSTFPPVAPVRAVRVFEPKSYGEMESVARMLKAGDLVVLALTQTAADLSRRILDFSFGAAAALDASVECVDDKVFVINRGEALSAAERGELRARGLIRS